MADKASVFSVDPLGEPRVRGADTRRWPLIPSLVVLQLFASLDAARAQSRTIAGPE